MDAAQEMVNQSRGKEEIDPRPKEDIVHHNSIPNHINNKNLLLPKVKHYKKWLRITIYILFLLVGQTTATLLGRLYFDKGGNSKWMATFVQSAGFPIFIPFLFFFSSSTTFRRPLVLRLTLIYIAFGLILTGDNLMYSYGLLYLPVSTYSLLCASQLAFNAVTSFFINAQKITALVLNSIVILTISVCLLAINANDEGNTTNNVSRGKYVIGFLCTLGASATYSLLLSLTQFSFEKVIKDESYNTVICMQFYPSIVATCGCVIGLFGSGEWRTLKGEMRDYKTGGVPYVLTLTFTAISWQVSSLGLIGLVFEVSSLFSNVISTLSLPMIPIFAVVFFHDKMNGVKVISLVLAMWGFLSYIYQHYLDNIEANKARKEKVDVTLVASTEMC
ncbi:probable purine permease 11 [Chenopodium quinoa]|uniref:Probable purine permease n=1 Tax=Chenopodium quinoa TaxID=63459 RepID=A0A803LU91_CHEQI|nr:probable purine permease 11 [Chenopodium quinoa]